MRRKRAAAEEEVEDAEKRRRLSISLYSICSSTSSDFKSSSNGRKFTQK